MRNDDENPGRLDAPAGRILYSGIGHPDPEDIEPAEYALAEGVPALMDETVAPPVHHRLEQPASAARPGYSALQLCAALLIGCFAGSALMPMMGTVFGRGPTFGGRPTSDQQIWLAGARSLARGELSALIQSHDAFLRIIELHGADEQLWNGVNRLATFAVVNKNKNEQAPRIAGRILQAFDFRTPPSSLRGMIRDLQAVAD